MLEPKVPYLFYSRSSVWRSRNQPAPSAAAVRATSPPRLALSVNPELVSCLSVQCGRGRGRKPIRGASKKDQPQEPVSLVTMQSFRAWDAGRELWSSTLFVICKRFSKEREGSANHREGVWILPVCVICTRSALSPVPCDGGQRVPAWPSDFREW